MTTPASLGRVQTLSIFLFGHFEARLDGIPLGGFDYNKVRALLAYLAVEQKQPHSRAALCALLWPDLGESAARQNLSQALTRLRQLLGDKQAPIPFILSTTETVQLNPAARWEVDVHAFLKTIKATERHTHHGWHLCTPCAIQLQKAADQYQGEFLAHLYLSDSTPFEEWALPLRHRLQSYMVSILERLARYAEWRGDLSQAIEITRRQIDLDPLREEAHRELMRLLALNGQQSAARSQYNTLRHLLHSEIGTVPEFETESLHEIIQSSPSAISIPRFAPPPSLLPAVPNEMVGRETERDAVCDQLREGTTRLLTITGAPGIGKTRLALEIGHRLRFEFQNGVQWVELAPILETDQVAAAIAQSLGIQEQPQRPLQAVILDYLKTHHTLLILDNFEQVLDAAPFLATLLRDCPHLSLLVTSRAPLHLRAEVQFTLEPLGLPALDAPFDWEEAITADAVKMFAYRARTIQPIWRLNAETIPAVTALCRRMDGLPLAIELIVPRLKSLSVAEILQQFESPLNAAPLGPRDMPARHRTLRSAIEWSYERLSAEEQRLFIHLGLFRGGCTAESAQAILGSSVSVMPLLESLHDVSLLYTRTEGNTTRFYQLETIREFARERLEASAEAPAAIARYIEYFVRLAENAYVQLLGTEQARWSVLLAAEQNNLRTAQQLAFDSHRIEEMLQIATGTWRFWWQRGSLQEVLAWLENGLATDTLVTGVVRTRALRAAGVLAMGLSDYPRARRHLEEALVVALQSKATYDHGGAHTNLGMLLRETGDFEGAVVHLEQAAALMRSLEEPRWVKFPLLVLASLSIRLGHIEQAATYYEEGLRLNRELGDTEGTANAMYGMGSVLLARGDYENARRWCQEGLALYQTLNHQFGIAWCYSILGEIEAATGNHAAALAHYCHTLNLWLQRGDDVNGARTLAAIADVLQQQGNTKQAAQLMGAVEAVYDRVQVRMTAHETTIHDGILRRCRDALGDSVFNIHWQQGHGCSLHEISAPFLQTT